jgi:hypothetical protein
MEENMRIINAVVAATVVAAVIALAGNAGRMPDTTVPDGCRIASVAAPAVVC